MCGRVSRPVRFSREVFSRTALESRPHMINLHTNVKGLLTHYISIALRAISTSAYNTSKLFLYRLQVRLDVPMISPFFRIIEFSFFAEKLLYQIVKKRIYNRDCNQG